LNLTTNKNSRKFAWYAPPPYINVYKKVWAGAFWHAHSL